MDERMVGIARINDRLRRTMPGGKVEIELSHLVSSSKVRAEVIRAVREFKDFDPEIDVAGDHSVGVIIVADNAYVFRFTYMDERYDYAQEVGKRKLSVMHASEFRSMKLGPKVEVLARKMLEQDVG